MVTYRQSSRLPWFSPAKAAQWAAMGLGLMAFSSPTATW